MLKQILGWGCGVAALGRETGKQRQLTSSLLAYSLAEAMANIWERKLVSCAPNFPPQNVSFDTFACGGLTHIEFIPSIH